MSEKFSSGTINSKQTDKKTHILIRLWIANSFLFLIFPCCYFYVMPQSTFSDQIRPCPHISYLNSGCIFKIFFFLFILFSIGFYPDLIVSKPISMLRSCGFFLSFSKLKYLMHVKSSILVILMCLLYITNSNVCRYMYRKRCHHSVDWTKIGAFEWFTRI